MRACCRCPPQVWLKGLLALADGTTIWAIATEDNFKRKPNLRSVSLDYMYLYMTRFVIELLNDHLSLEWDGGGWAWQHLRAIGCFLVRGAACDMPE